MQFFFINNRLALKITSYLLICTSLITSCNEESETGKVVGVKDGDTIVVLTPDQKNITVRLAQIDCPEKSQAFGKAAKHFTSDLCFNKKVKLIGDIHDQYGRTVAMVILADGTNVNYELVKNGYAWQYRAYSTDTQLMQFEQNARQNRLGLWKQPHPTPPWKYRRKQRAKQPYQAADDFE